MGTVVQTSTFNFGIEYGLTMPSPLRMVRGLYRGQTTFSIAPGADFDFGNGVTNLNSSTLTLNFELQVNHSFVLDFPPGSERAVLEPPNGWLDWVNRGRKPQRLYREHPFRIWSSGPFKVYMRCDQSVGQACAIQNGEGHDVPVQVALSLPETITHSGTPVKQLPIPTRETAALVFDSLASTLNRQGRLHYEVAREHAGEMLKYPGTTYSGNVTLVFDAEL
ncbi:hypothetical protein GUY40_01730 [Pseudomonas sp. R5(2019)]|nr:hypothetical protein [Pseudomonas sp. R5(2019)]